MSYIYGVYIVYVNDYHKRFGPYVLLYLRIRPSDLVKHGR